MRTMEIKVFKFDELDGAAKVKAKLDYQADCGYAWEKEAMDSIQALAKHFGGKMTNWGIDWFGSSHSSATFDMPEMDAQEIREKLRALGTFNQNTLKGHGDCKLTGVCHDEDAIDGFRIAFIRSGKRDLGELMDAAFDSWLKAAQNDCAGQYEDAQFSETCEAYNYEFRENGELV